MIQRHIQFTDIFTYAIVEDWSLFTVLLFSSGNFNNYYYTPTGRYTVLSCLRVQVYGCTDARVRVDKLHGGEGAREGADGKD